jgi:hypothetical protein
MNDSHLLALEVTITCEPESEDLVLDAMLEREFELDERREVDEGVELTFTVEYLEYEGLIEDAENWCHEELLGSSVTGLADEIEIAIEA